VFYHLDHLDHVGCDVKGCFFFVGAALPGELRPHHKSVFDFDERAMLISASMFVRIVYLALNGEEL
jgi:metal-dependent amidase/aminoacylase/carboxypeptidase family protein